MMFKVIREIMNGLKTFEDIQFSDRFGFNTWTVLSITRTEIEIRLHLDTEHVEVMDEEEFTGYCIANNVHTFYVSDIFDDSYIDTFDPWNK